MTGRRPDKSAGAPASTEPAQVTPALLEEWALSYLGRYASSAANLRWVLLRRARRRLRSETPLDKAVREAIDALIARYRDGRLIDDAAYADSQVRRGVARGRSLKQIAAGLMAKGIGPDDAAVALGALREGSRDADLAAAIALARRRGFGPFQRDTSRDIDKQRALAAFARAGFARQTAERVMACRDEAAVAALLASED